MDSIKLSAIATMARGELLGQDVTINGLSTDSRQVKADQLFVALKGEKFDGHNFIDEQLCAQASALFLQRDVDSTLPKIIVDDTLLGLSNWAQAWRNKVNPLVIGVTGSNGKTTVKQMLSSIFSRLGPTCSTQGNLNNHIGVPLTLLQLEQHDQYAVIEMGANHLGEINHLSHLVTPDIAIITNAGPAHLEGFGSIQGVAQGKGEIINGVKPNGIIVLNADDQYLTFWSAKARHLQIVTFGFSAQADIRGDIALDGQLDVQSEDSQLTVKLPILGKHNACNALAVIAAAKAAGVSDQNIKLGLESMIQASSRLQIKTAIKGAQIIDDSYNANPASLSAAIEVLCAQSSDSWLVLGDMGELGTDAANIHTLMGQLAKSAGVKKLFALGQLSKYAAASFGDNGFSFTDHQTLADAVMTELHQGCCVLVKGSRAMQMEKIVNLLITNEAIH